jgi:spore coat protein H
LYTLTEIVDDTLIETQFEDDNGNVYKPSGNGATSAEGSFSEQAFDKQTNQDEGDWSDIMALFKALHAESRTSAPEKWRNEFEAVFDVDEFLNWLAVNTVIQNWDTYGTMSHNYYLYHDPVSDKLVWIPWDNNEALIAKMGTRSTTSFEMDEIDERWPLIRFLLNDEVYHATYVSYVKAVINGAFEPEQMEGRYREYVDLIESSVRLERTSELGVADSNGFNVAIEELVQHAYARYDNTTYFLAQQ